MLPNPDDPGGGGTGTAPGTGPVTPANNGSWIGIVGYKLNLTLAARVDVIAKFKQSFSNGNASWATQLLINGQIVDSAYGQATLDVVTLMGSQQLPAGSYDITVRWAGLSSITTYNGRIKPFWSFK